MPDIQRPEPNVETITGKVWVIYRTDKAGDDDVVLAAADTRELALEEMGAWRGENVRTDEVTFYRQSLRPVYGGGTLIENLWAEMDAIMERLMTGQGGQDVCGRTDCMGDPQRSIVCGHWDNGDKYRAEELAWVLAIVTNAYDPDINRIRKETMSRWEAAEREAALQEEALNPDQPEDEE
jgi:hypothetical protein